MKESCSRRMSVSGLRMTPLRQTLLDLLHSTMTPLSVPDIERHLRKLRLTPNKTTVYRTLELFEGIGLVMKTVVNDRTQYYELTERGHHHHFICTECDAMKDVPLSETSVLRDAEKLGKKFGFTIKNHMLEFYGFCANCSNRGSVHL